MIASFFDRFRRKSDADQAGAVRAESAHELGQATLKKLRPAPPEAPAEECVTLMLGDFLPRIPAKTLLAAEHDPASEIPFSVNELYDMLARGRTRISLARIYRTVPAIFRGEIRESDHIDVRFPWQRLLELVRAADAGAPAPGFTESAIRALEQKLRMRTRPPAPPVSIAEAVDITAKPPRTPNSPPAAEPIPFPAPAVRPVAPATSAAPAPEAEAQSPTVDLIAVPVFTADAAVKVAATTESHLAAEIKRICEAADQEMALIQARKNELAALHERFAEAERNAGERDALRAALEARANELAELHKNAVVELDEVRIERDQLRAAAEQRHGELALTQQLLAEAEKALSDRDTQRPATEGDQAELEQARRELARLRSTAEVGQNELDSLRESFTRIEQERDALRAERDEARGSGEAQREEFDALQRRLLELEQAAACTAQERDDQRMALEARNEELARARREHDEARAAAEARQEEFGALQHRFGEVEHAVHSIMQERDALCADLEARGQELGQANANLDALRGERDEARHTAEARQNELDALRQRLAEVEQLAQSAAQERGAQGEALGVRDEELAQARSSLAELRRKIADDVAALLARWDECRATVEARKGDLAALRERLAHAEQATQAAMQERDAQRVQLAEGLREIEALDADALRCEQQAKRIQERSVNGVETGREATASEPQRTDEELCAQAP